MVKSSIKKYKTDYYTMPELPEVETVCHNLKSSINNKTIINITTSDKKLRYPLNLELKNKIIGAQIIDVKRRGKYIIINTNSSISIIIHLGMSGALIYNKKEIDKHCHVTINFNNGEYLRYIDPRRFGFVQLVKNEPRYLQSLGPEPFDIKTHDLFAKVKNRFTKIKTLLLNQTIIAGIGNIYVCEALFLSGIHPATPANKINLVQLENIMKHIINVLNKAIQAGGTTLKDYRNIDGLTGKFKRELLVYGLEYCTVCSNKIEKVTIGQRGTYFCSNCQK